MHEHHTSREVNIVDSEGEKQQQQKWLLKINFISKALASSDLSRFLVKSYEKFFHSQKE